MAFAFVYECLSERACILFVRLSAGEECAICLEELKAGDRIARLPCLCIYHLPYKLLSSPSTSLPSCIYFPICSCICIFISLCAIPSLRLSFALEWGTLLSFSEVSCSLDFHKYLIRAKNLRHSENFRHDWEFCITLLLNYNILLLFDTNFSDFNLTCP